MPSTGLSLKEVRIVDPILTTIAQGYANQELIGNQIFPLVETALYGGQIITFDKAAFRTYNSKRAPGANTKRIQTSYGSLPFSLVLDALEHAVPIEHLNDSNMIGIDWSTYAVNACMGGLALNLEVDQAALATTLGNYATNNRITLSGGAQWSTAAAPLGSIIRAGKEAVRSAIGVYPNVWEMSASVFAAVQELTEVKDRLKFTSSESLTADMLANWYNFSKVIIGAAVQADSTATEGISDVWGKDSFMFYANPLTLNGQRINYSTTGAINRFQPSYGYTYVMRGMPFVKQRYYDNNADSWIFGAKFDRQPVTTGVSGGLITSGFLIKNAIA